jgi:hypothetical protein
MSVTTILSDVVRGFEKVFAVGTKVAIAEEPLIDDLFPGIAIIFNSIATEAGVVEAASAAAGAQSGTGTQKAATVLTNVTPSVIATAQANGMATPTAAELEIASSAVVTFLNVFKPAASTSKV